MKKFKNKVVWITGASSGIGLALVKELSQYTSKIILSSRRVEELNKVKESCTNNSEMMVLPLDLTNFDCMKEKAQKVFDKYGNIDILINNGGVSQRSLAIDASIDTDINLMNINYFGTVSLTKAVLPYMIDQKQGHLIVMSSVTGKIGVPLRSAYAASKHALFGFFDTLRAELFEQNIHVTLFCPGYVNTNLADNALRAKNAQKTESDKAIENGMHPQVLAKKILLAVEKNRKEVYIGGKEVLGIYIRRFFPSLFFKIIRKQKF